MQCTLCSSTAVEYCRDRKRRYFRCGSCDLVFADPQSRLTAADEKVIYDFHENDPNDPGYRRFLAQLSTPLIERLSPGMRGLDFGCGPGPTLNLLLEEQGMSMDLYDLYYFPDKSTLQPQYDFVTATEVVEHFRQPAESWRELVELVKPDGWLGVMTALMNKASIAEFKNWHYKNDLTHVSFYSPQTIAWLAHAFKLDCHILSERVVLFKRRRFE